MSNLERWLWAGDFVIGGIGWFFGGPYAAILCFAVAGLLIFIALTTKEQAESKHRIMEDEHTVYVRGVKKWHKFGIGVSILSILGLIAYGIFRYEKKQPSGTQTATNSQSSQSATSATAGAGTIP